jgi:hypothetical protein
MTMIQMINYVHMHFVEYGEKPIQNLKGECAMEIQLKDWEVKKDTEVLNANDNLFQLAFCKGAILDNVAEILKMWEESAIKGQKSKKQPKGKIKGNDSRETEAKSLVEDMKQTE